MKTLIPFDLEKALAGEAVITKEGTSVKIAGYNPDAKPQNALVVWVDGWAQSYDVDGKIWGTDPLAPQNLRMAPKPDVKFYNVMDGCISNLDASSIEQCLAVTDTCGMYKSICKISILNGEVISAETVHLY